MRGTASECIYREVKVMMIGGGAEEIMKSWRRSNWAGSRAARAQLPR